MKKAIAALVMVLLSLQLVGAQAEYTFFNWPSSHQSVGIPDAVIQHYGDGETYAIFFVEVMGNGWLELRQTKGTCQELSYVKLISGFLGTAKEWGKYEVEVHHAESNVYWTYQWDDTYNNESFRINFDRSGHYYVTVRPYTNQEMTDSYLLDMFAGWEEPPEWRIYDWRNCRITTWSPFE